MVAVGTLPSCARRDFRAGKRFVFLRGGAGREREVKFHVEHEGGAEDLAAVACAAAF